MAIVPRKIGLKRPYEGKMMLHDPLLNPYLSIPTKGRCVEERREECCQQKMIHVTLLPAMKQSWKICLWFSDQRSLVSRIQLR